MSNDALTNEANEFRKKIYLMVMKWRQENKGRQPKYFFLSKDAHNMMIDYCNENLTMMVTPTHFMGIEIVPVNVLGIYAAIGEEF